MTSSKYQGQQMQNLQIAVNEQILGTLKDYKKQTYFP